MKTEGSSNTENAQQTTARTTLANRFGHVRTKGPTRVLPTIIPQGSQRTESELYQMKTGSGFKV